MKNAAQKNKSGKLRMAGNLNLVEVMKELLPKPGRGMKLVVDSMDQQRAFKRKTWQI